MYIDKSSDRPVFLQIEDGIRQMILDGVLLPGDQLPSVRELSSTLSVNPNTIAKAYAELGASRLTVSVHGSGSFVSPEALGLIKEQETSRLPELEAMIDSLLKAGIDKDKIRATVENTLSRKGDSQ